MQRRTLLRVGAATAVALGAAGAGFALIGSAWKNDRLTPAGRAVFTAVARAVLDGLLPSPPQAALDGHIDRLDATIAGFSPALHAEVTELVTLLAHAPGRIALAGLATSWADATTAELLAMLQRLRTSPLTLRQQVYHALRDLTNAAWFAAPANWAAVGYPGPRAL